MPTSRIALPLSSHICRGQPLAVESMLSEVEGVVAVLVDSVSEMAYVEYDPARADPEALFGVLQRSGFAAAGALSRRGPNSSF